MIEKKKEKAIIKSLQIYVGQDKMSVARTVNKQIEMLSMLTPEKYIMQRPGPGGIVLDYVETNYVIGRLNATFMFNWDAEIIQQIIDRDNDQIAIKVRLTIRFANEQEVKKDAWGGSSIKRSGDKSKYMDLANDLKSAESDGIKKAASMIGICWDVYSGLASGKERQSKAKDVNGFTGYKQDEKKNIFRNIPIVIQKKTIMHTKYEVLDRFKAAKAKLGNEVYYKVLGSNGYEKSDQISEADIQKLYDAMLLAFEEEKIIAKKAKKPAEEVEPEKEDEEVKEAEVVEEPSPKEKPAEEAEVVEEPEEQLGFTAEEVEKEQAESVPEFQPAKKPEEKEKPEMPLQREKMSLTGLELQLVDKYNFTPDQICERLKEMFGEDQIEKLTRKQTQEGIEFFKETIELMEKKKAKEKFSK